MEEKQELVIVDTREVLGKQFTAYGTIEDPIFLGEDIANWLENDRARAMLEKIDDDEKLKVPFKTATSRSTQDQWFVTEQGMYECLFQSRKPLAKEFKKEVKNILKTIRLTGGYISKYIDVNDSKAIQDMVDKNIKLTTENKKLAEDNNCFNSSLKTYTSTDIITSMTPEEKLKLKELAKGARANNLHTYLIELGLVYKHKPANGDPYYIVTKDYAMLGLNKLEEVNTINNKTGAWIIIGSTRWTTAGKIFIKELLANPVEYLKEAKIKNKEIYDRTPNMDYLNQGVK